MYRRAKANVCLRCDQLLLLKETGDPLGYRLDPAEDLAKSADERKSSLDRTLADRGAQGWRIENRSYFQATIASGNRINHVLHLILTIVTAGLWGIVWIILAITGGIKRHLITVDEYGNVVERKI